MGGTQAHSRASERAAAVQSNAACMHGCSLRRQMLALPQQMQPIQSKAAHPHPAAKQPTCTHLSCASEPQPGALSWRLSAAARVEV